ncbi:hypothetical protein [[Flexibacter] sp. ATCC 35103]|uniref:hypothetical protein n=1 Tax=[Flexibacter] sp. ATCC 35103 TaxID=1937528 RepID=UPI0009CF26EA|nr:hypothetical protein [[Flexibacter] sp. ATCC 35103]OMQ11887.1 hypothetical protein BXU01_10250 [[Flexibacter] sp. ATCC 35103]
MPNNTFEDYKIAVKKKYEIEKNGDHSFYLSSPTRARLRNLCWELFQQQNRNQDDLNVFSSLLGLAFDVNKRNKFDEQIDKFRPIDNYFKGESDPANVDAVNMAAILVDFKARPFNKFRIQELFEDEIQIENEDKLELPSPEMEQRVEKDKIDNSGDLEKFLVEKEKEKGREKGIEDETPRFRTREKITDIEVRQPTINSFAGIEKNPEKVEKREESGKSGINWKHAIVFASVFLFVGFVVIYFAFPNKECMQWSGDHYEIVDCELKIEGIGKSYNIEILDPTLVNLKKVKVCDTTTYFDKNGVAIIWYAKTANGIDFFNIHGRHPENNSPLRPVTHYILNKYVKK